MSGGVRWIPTCYLCGTESPDKVPDATGDWRAVECDRCGRYQITGTADIALKNGSFANQKWILAGLVRNASDQNQVLRLSTETIPQLVESAPLPASFLDVMDGVLLRVARGRNAVTGFSGAVKISMDEHTRLFLGKQRDMSSALSALTDAGYLQAPVKIVDGVASAELTAKGWERVAELQRASVDSWQAFVAMWFAPDMTSAYDDGIAPALRATGYMPVRVDRIQYEGKVDDRIIAELKRSGLVVADFTDHRGGVYFEAGFAMGRGNRLIFSCRADEIGKAHFDTRQYNHIVWTDPADLKEQLENRIRALYPTRAPIVAATTQFRAE